MGGEESGEGLIFFLLRGTNGSGLVGRDWDWDICVWALGIYGTWEGDYLVLGSFRLVDLHCLMCRICI